MLKESDIAYEQGEYWVLRVPTGYEVYKNTITHSVRCARIGYTGQHGMDRSIAEIARRIAADVAKCTK